MAKTEIPSKTHRAGASAAVLGGSIAGLLAARVLADHYDRVTILERDELPSGPDQRRGVPQGRHTHGLLISGCKVLETLFPTISQQLVESGAVEGDVLGDARWFFEGGPLYRYQTGERGLMMTRPFLERFVRERVFQLPNVSVRQGAPVEGLTATPDNGRVIGVKLAGETVQADIVVDATGRGSRSPRWLEALGYGKPEEERVEVGIAYTTRFFRRKPEHLGGDLLAVIPPTPNGRRGGVMLAQEGDRWTVTLIEHFGSSAPPDIDGFVEYARTLPAPYIHQVIRGAEPLGDAAQARFPASLRRRYERMRRFPEGYLVIGDAVSSFNPIYGQGMSSAALQAMELKRTLQEGADGLAQRFFPRAAKVVDIPWSIAAGNDMRIPQTLGRRTPGVHFVNWYIAKLHKAAHADRALSWAFIEVMNLMAPPPNLMRPRLALHVLKGNLFGNRGRGLPKPSLGPDV